jgi:hypothetical protein
MIVGSLKGRDGTICRSLELGHSRTKAMSDTVPCGLRRALGALGLALAVGCAGTGARPSTAAFSFALIGDTPYGSTAEDRLATMLREIDDDPSVRFVLHAGDLKGGGETCTDELLRRRLALMQEVSGALVYTPGDNDWTDCHRAAAGRFPPLERLAALRRLAFADPTHSMGKQPLRLRSQAEAGSHGEFVENALFVHERVMFLTVHVVGSRNALAPWHGIDPSDSAEVPRRDRIAAFEARQAANLSWLEAAFGSAQHSGVIAVVVLMHANLRFALAPGHPQRAGFEAVIQALHRLSLRLGRPVLLAHGDGHLFLVDQPLASGSPPVRNLIRVQSWGEPLSGWIRVGVDPARSGVFEISTGTRIPIGH